jgi:cytochrome c-type biogenesis protein CcmH
MVFWILVAGLVAVVTLVVTRPLLRPVPRGEGADESPSAAAADVAVYKDQLKEVAVDEASGTLGSVEAESARSEIARRLLRSTAATGKGEAPAPVGRYRFAMYASVLTSVTLPLASLALYLHYGTPDLPGDPFNARIADKSGAAKPNDLIAKVEERLRQHPEDGTGWSVIAPVYYAMGRYDDAATAYSHAIRLLGETPERLQGFANARIRDNNGIIPDDARKALHRILVLEPNREEPRIWLALAKEQDGKLTEAAADYRSLLDKAPKNVPWRKVIEARLAALTAGGDQKTPAGTEKTANAEASSGAPASAPDAAAVSAMTPEQRQAFITRMVDGLATRLKADGSDAAGWLKLIRAYKVLGRHDDAVKALSDARTNLKGDQAGLARVEGLARELGLGS